MKTRQSNKIIEVLCIVTIKFNDQRQISIGHSSYNNISRKQTLPYFLFFFQGNTIFQQDLSLNLVSQSIRKHIFSIRSEINSISRRWMPFFFFLYSHVIQKTLAGTFCKLEWLATTFVYTSNDAFKQNSSSLYRYRI